MDTRLSVLVFFIHVTFASPAEVDSKVPCSTLSCVHASATILQKLDTEIDPCEDFYGYACGTFIDEQHTPDEKATVNTQGLMSDKLTEYLLTLLLKPATGEAERELHKLAKSFFNSCHDIDRVNNRGKQPILNLIKAVGPWPLLDGSNWDESQFDISKTILKLRQYISKYNEDIFSNDIVTNEIPQGNKNFGAEDADLAKVEEGLKTLIRSFATSLYAEDTPELRKQIEELIEYEKKIDDYLRTFKRFKTVHKKVLHTLPSVPDFQIFYKSSLYAQFMAPFILENITDVTGNVPIEFFDEFREFVKNADKRAMANAIIWRIVQASLPFLDKDLRNIVTTFEKDAIGKEDNDQRWIFCSNLVTVQAPVAIGSLYISQYFTEEDKKIAENLVEFILEEFTETVKNATWMDADTKERALFRSGQMKRYIGYHEKLLSPEAETFYSSLPPLNEDHFLEMGMAFTIFNADREFKRLHPPPGQKIEKDWTKYSKPATVNAFYNNKDNTIQFPAAILQTPNFDKDRPPYMNFGAIGSIIGHEITHSFDAQASNLDSWSQESIEKYKAKVKCIVDQYSSFRVPEIEDYFQLLGVDLGKVTLNGKITEKEDIADCGGIKLAYYAFRNYVEKFPDANILPIGLHEYSLDQIFWMSYAQSFCSVERPPRMKNKIDTENHSLDKFRVIGTLSNMEEFSRAWNCSIGMPMNPKTKCAVW